MRKKLIIAALALAILITAASRIKESDSETFRDIYYQNSITLAEFDAVKTGMTYEEVCEIFYEEGILLTETDVGPFDLGLEYELTYMWEGAGLIGANVKITFRHGKVIEKEQIGLTL